MRDIVEQLRDKHCCDATKCNCDEAADEIERLRAAMHDLAGHVWRGDWDKLKPETRAALGEKE